MLQKSSMSAPCVFLRSHLCVKGFKFFAGGAKIRLKAQRVVGNLKELSRLFSTYHLKEISSLNVYAVWRQSISGVWQTSANYC
jgi:hypothetical protein